jgi:hypothetical protein
MGSAKGQCEMRQAASRTAAGSYVNGAEIYINGGQHV